MPVAVQRTSKTRDSHRLEAVATRTTRSSPSASTRGSSIAVASSWPCSVCTEDSTHRRDQRRPAASEKRRYGERTTPRGPVVQESV
jgi:hypothetical protein